MIELFKALADENRLRIVNLLMRCGFCVCEIEVLLQMTQSNVSRHLSKLKSANIISSSKDAQWVHYKVSDGFNDENELLHSYMAEKFEASPVFSNDIARYDKYIERRLNCQSIGEDRDKVLELISEI